jgi:iron complex outermembrane receptor protein
VAAVRALGCLFLLLIIGEEASSAQNVPQADFKKLTLEELMDVDVTSVSRKAEPLGRTAAAITVITPEDIRRSGATTIPELLRLVPGLDVARFNAGSWAISARGFNSTAANKLLVLIDGRTVYSPLFSGTFWEIQDLLLEDIARIEVVRGPGATLWGGSHRDVRRS